jgi:perosamine synthetase
MQAALGTAQLERLGELLKRKRDLFAWYSEGLAGVPGITLNTPSADTEATYWMITLIVDPAHRWEKRALQDRFADFGIDTRPFFHPLSSLPAYQNHPGVAEAKARNREAYRISPWGLNLPSALNLTHTDVRKVCETLKGILGSTPK